MTNRDKLFQMTNRELAEILVCVSDYEETDYDWDEEPYRYIETRFGNDLVGWYDDHEDAVLETIEWLELQGSNCYINDKRR